ncbi:MAG TPA: hypothetical protein VGR84_08405 [Candidatus Acidoferrales bacterium]|nr:hypothetical protein [Candidatus Acidoferrales bacterium]
MNGQSRPEYPIGKVLDETAGYVSDLRFSSAATSRATNPHSFFPAVRVFFSAETSRSARHGATRRVIAGGTPQPVTPEGTSDGFVSPDGRSVLVQITGGKYLVYPVGGGPTRPVPWLSSDDVIIRWRRDGHFLLVYDGSQIPAQVESVDLSTGRRSFVRELVPADRAGVVRILHATFARGPKSYAYSYDLALSRLAVVEGVK